MFLTQLYQRTGGNQTPPLSLTQIQEYLSGLVIEDANGFNGTVDGSTGVPLVTLETTVTGITYGDGTGLFPVTIGANLDFTAGVLSASGGGGSSPAGLAFAARHG